MLDVAGLVPDLGEKHGVVPAVEIAKRREAVVGDLIAKDQAKATGQNDTEECGKGKETLARPRREGAAALSPAMWPLHHGSAHTQP